MANHCSVSLTLRTKRGNEEGLARVLHAYMFPSQDGAKSVATGKFRDFVLKLGLNADEMLFDPYIIYERWNEVDDNICFSQDGDNLGVNVYSVCAWSAHTSFIGKDGLGYKGENEGVTFIDLCTKFNVDFSVATTESGMDFGELYVFEGGRFTQNEEVNLTDELMSEFEKALNPLTEHDIELIKDALHDTFGPLSETTEKLNLKIDQGSEFDDDDIENLFSAVYNAGYLSEFSVFELDVVEKLLDV